MSMLATKLLVGEAVIGLAAVTAANASIDGTAQRIIVYAAAGAGLLWFWANVLRPLARIIHQAAEAIDHLEQIPTIVSRQRVLERAARENRSAILAICREFGIDFRRLTRTTAEPIDEFEVFPPDDDAARRLGS